VAWRGGLVALRAGEIANLHADKIVLVIGMEFAVDGGEGAED